jgi:hypothetical protein
MKPGPTNNRLVVVTVTFLACGLSSYFLVSRLRGTNSETPGTKALFSPSNLAHDEGRLATPTRSGARPIPPPRWDAIRAVPDISVPELSAFERAALESHNDLPRAQMFTQLRSAVIRTMSPLISAARSKCPGEILRSTVRLRLTIESNANQGAEIASVDEIINFAGAPVADGTLTCIFTNLKNHTFPVPITSVPKSNLVTFKGETFVSARL